MATSENARLYAIEALELEIEKLAKAYDAGYKQAYKEIGAAPVNIDGIKYYDFGLPSGTLWSHVVFESKNHFLRLPYKKANILNIPTKEQFMELMQFCQISWANGIMTCLGRSGESMGLSVNDSFWIKDSYDEIENAGTFIINKSEQIKDCFIGTSNFVLLVKNENEL